MADDRRQAKSDEINWDELQAPDHQAGARTGPAGRVLHRQRAAARHPFAFPGCGLFACDHLATALFMVAMVISLVLSWIC